MCSRTAGISNMQSMFYYVALTLHDAYRLSMEGKMALSQLDFGKLQKLKSCIVMWWLIHLPYDVRREFYQEREYI